MVYTPSETPLKKTNFSFVSAYLLARASGLGMRTSVCFLRLSTGIPSGLDLGGRSGDFLINEDRWGAEWLD